VKHKQQRKNPHAVALGRRGGLKKSAAKKAAAKLNIEKRWSQAVGKLIA
jgi:hypothetical protein